MRTVLMIVLFGVSVAATGQVRISQIYGGGGNSGAVWTHDFVELVNVGTVAVDLSGWSIRYASGAGTTWQMTPLSGSIQPRHYYLVQEAAGGGGISPLPTPDAVGTIAMSATAGKVVLMMTQAAVTGGCPAGPDIVDLVGFGSSATCFEGDSAASGAGVKTAILRRGGGMVDTGDNGSDFESAMPAPRASSSGPLAVRHTGYGPVGAPGARVECYPSPFNNTTQIQVTIARAGVYTLAVMNVLGEEVQVLLRGALSVGTRVFTLAAGSLPSGVYFCVLEGEGVRVAGRLLLLR